MAASNVDRAATEELRQHAFELHEQGELRAAERDYHEILRRAPEDFEVMHALGVLAVQTGRYSLALELMPAVLLHRPTAAAYGDLGNAYLGLSLLGDAIQSYDRALELQPRLPSVHLNRGGALRSLGRNPEALASYATATLLQPDFAPPYIESGRI